MAIMYRDLIKMMVWNSGGLYFENYAGNICLSDLDTPVSGVKTITEAMVKVDGNNNAIWNYNHTPSSEIYTGIELFYKPVIPMKMNNSDTSGSGYSRKYCYTINHPAGEDLDPVTNAAHNLLTESAIYRQKLSEAQDYIGQERKITFHADAIRDEATAEKLLKLLIQWHCRPLAVLNLTCTYAVLDMEIFDAVECTCSFLPSFLTGLIWKVTAMRIQPNILGREPQIQLELTQYGNSNTPELVDWVEVGVGTGNDKVEIITATKTVTETGNNL